MRYEKNHKQPTSTNQVGKTCTYFFRDIDGKCVDIDECKAVPSPCEQICINTNGTYSCDCNPGYLLTASGGCISTLFF